MQLDSLKSAPPAQVEGTHQELRFLRLPDVMRMTARGRTTTLSGVREGTFPQPVKVGRATLWLEHEVRAWMLARVLESRGEGVRQ